MAFMEEICVGKSETRYDYRLCNGCCHTQTIIHPWALYITCYCFEVQDYDRFLFRNCFCKPIVDQVDQTLEFIKPHNAAT